jgi:hypothetical protein
LLCCKGRKGAIFDRILTIRPAAGERSKRCVSEHAAKLWAGVHERQAPENLTGFWQRPCEKTLLKCCDCEMIVAVQHAAVPGLASVCPGVCVRAGVFRGDFVAYCVLREEFQSRWKDGTKL